MGGLNGIFFDLMLQILKGFQQIRRRDYPLDVSGGVDHRQTIHSIVEHQSDCARYRGIDVYRDRFRRHDIRRQRRLRIVTVRCTEDVPVGNHSDDLAIDFRYEQMAKGMSGQKIDSFAEQILRLQLDDAGGHELADTARRSCERSGHRLILIRSRWAFVWRRRHPCRSH